MVSTKTDNYNFREGRIYCRTIIRLHIFPLGVSIKTNGAYVTREMDKLKNKTLYRSCICIVEFLVVSHETKNKT